MLANNNVETVYNFLFSAFATHIAAKPVGATTAKGVTLQ